MLSSGTPPPSYNVSASSDAASELPVTISGTSATLDRNANATATASMSQSQTPGGDANASANSSFTPGTPH